MQAAGRTSQLIPAVLISALAAVSGAQASTNGVLTLEEITVKATRLQQDPFVQPYALYLYDREDIDTGIGRTALDRLDLTPGIILQRTSPGQSSPYIRGLTGKQSLLLLDGVRLSHATMRGGPNQYSALVPDMSLDGVDAILGSSGVVNGSDGLTGAIDLRLARAGRGVDQTVSSWLNARIDSANGSQTALGFDGVLDDWRYSIEGSFFNFHDRVGGKNADDNLFGGGADGYDRIPNTAYDQWALAGRAAYDGLANRSIELAAGHTRQNEARRPDGYYENSGKSDRISRYYDPETFTYLHVRDSWRPDNLFFDRLTTTFWWHQQDEAQIREQLTIADTVYRRREYDDRIDSFGVEPQAKSLVGNHELTYGVLALFERTRNDYREYRNTGGTRPLGATPYDPNRWSQNTTITDGAEYNTYALYVQDLWQIDDQWSLLSGLRYTYVDWSFDVADHSADDVTGSLRASYRLSDDMLVFAGVSKAFRAPNLNDLDGATDRGSSGVAAFGNPNLDPEVSYSGETGWRFERGRDQLGVSLFYTYLDDVIQTVYPTGGGSGLTENGESAYLRGAELLWDYGLPIPAGLGRRLALVGSVSYTDTEARVPQTDGSILEEPISRANRLYGSAGIRYELDRNWWSKVQARFHDDYGKGDLASGDASDVRLTVPGNSDGTVSGFTVVDVSAGWQNDEADHWVTVAVENVADKTYRQLGSGADAPGLNFVLAGGVRF